MKTQSKTRKVIKLNKCKAIILPKEFTDKAGINYGDIVGLTYDSILVVVTPKPVKEKEDGLAHR